MVIGLTSLRWPLRLIAEDAPRCVGKYRRILIALFKRSSDCAASGATHVESLRDERERDRPRGLLLLFFPGGGGLQHHLRAFEGQASRIESD